MATAVSTLIQRSRRFVGDWPDQDVTTASISSSSATLTVADSSIYGTNWIIQVDQEAMRVKALPSATTLTVMRGIQGSTAASHATAATVLVRPAWTDQEYLDAVNAAIDATFPFYYQPVTDTSLTSDGATYEFAVPNMPNTSVPIPFLYKIEVKISGDPAWRQANRWDVRRSSSPIIKFRSMVAPGTIRVHGFGPFSQVGFTDSLPALWPVWGDDVLLEYIANKLLMSGEARRVRQDVGAKDNRENANQAGSSSAAASQLYQRFLFRLQQQPMPPLPKHVVPTF
jgi:hypothetical protein